MKLDRNMRIFQGKTVPEIVKEVLNEYQVKVDDNLTENFRAWGLNLKELITKSTSIRPQIQALPQSAHSLAL